MSVNYGDAIFTQIKETETRVSQLREMLRLNRIAQSRLLCLGQQVDNRKRELLELGVFVGYAGEYIANMVDPSSPVNQVRKVPAILVDQQLIKKNLANDYGFMKNIMNEDKETKFKKTKTKQKKICLSALDADPKTIDFVAIGEKCGKLGLEVYREWRLNLKSRMGPVNKFFNALDEQRLVEKKKIYGDNWQKIGYFFNGFSFQDLYYYYQKNLKKVDQGKWTKRHNLMLIALAEYYGQGKWASISKKLKCKSQYQIRQRFCNVLDPKLKQNRWNEDTQELLKIVAPLKNYKWSKIAKEVPELSNKTDNQLRRKYRNLMIKLDDEQITKQIKTKKLRDSILKFKKDYYGRRKTKKQLQDDEQKLQSKMEQESIK